MSLLPILAYSATYTATKSGNWNAVSTWGGSGYPQAGDNAILNQAYTITLTADAACLNLENSNTGTISLGSYNIYVSGNLTFNCTAGKFTTTAGYVVLNGTSQTINLCTGGGNTIPNLRLTNSTNVSMGPQTSLTITGNLDCQTGSSTLTNNNFSGWPSGALIVSGTCTAPNCTFIAGTNINGTAIDFSSSTSNPVQVGGIIDNQSTAKITFGAKNVVTTTAFSGTYTNNITTTGTLTVLTQATFNANGSYTVPDGVTSIQVEAWGAGGGGGYARSNDNASGGGGGGGAYTKTVINVTPGQIITYTVGAGGSGGTSGGIAPNNGGTTTFNSSVPITATGGSAGTSSTNGNGTGGSGGSGGTYLGGKGANGQGNNGGGGGGSSAGTTSNGVDATTQAGAAAVTGGGSGGSGSSGSNGGGGNTPGGGGAGGERNGSNKAGGNGGNGQITVTYLPTIKGNVYIYLGATSTLSNFSTGGTWTSANTSVATISASGIVTALSAGNTLITYTVSGMFVTTTVTVYPVTATITNTSCPLVSDGGISLVAPNDYAVEFNHIDKDYIDLGGKLLTNRSAFTLEGWIKYNKADITGERYGSLFGQNDVIEFGVFNATNFQIWTANGGSLDVPITQELGDNTWHHIAATGSGTTLTVYVDGVARSTGGSTTINYGTDTNYNACIGGGIWDGYTAANSQTFPGQIKRVGMYSRALSASEIAADYSYNKLYTGTETGLIAGYNFSEGTGTTINSLPAGKNGTFGNTPIWIDLLSYSWTKAGDGTFVRNTRSFSAIGIGDYTVIASNAYIKAVQAFTVNSNNTCDNYWVGSISDDWGNTENWSAKFAPGLNTGTGKNVTFSTIANNGTVTANDLKLDAIREIGNLTNATTKRLIIPAGKGLKINGNISITPPVTVPAANAADLIVIQANSSIENGSLIFPNAKNVQGTVEMYSKAYKESTPITLNGVSYSYNWQFFGIPLTIVTANPTFYGSYVRQYQEDKPGLYTKWNQLDNSSVLKSFKGYEITQNTAKVLTFQGVLVNNDTTISLPVSNLTTVYFRGQHLLSNPYTAAIDARQLVYGPNTENTVYLYNTGSFGNWVQNSGGTTYDENSATAGQYTALPKLAAGTNSIPYDIPSMSGFLVKGTDSLNYVPGSITIKYSSVITRNINPQRVKTENTTSSSDLISTKIDLTGLHYSDRMWIFTEPSCTKNFDNGWDGRKMLGSSLAPQIYAVEPDGDYQVNSVDDMHNTYIAFQPGDEVEYTLKFTNENIKRKYAGVYLVDLLENKTVDVTESGSTYKFATAPASEPSKRFKIITRYYEKDAPDTESTVKIFCARGTVYIQNLSTYSGECTLYDVLGRTMIKKAYAPNSITEIVGNLTQGAYITTAITNRQKVSKRIIVQ